MIWYIEWLVDTSCIPNVQEDFDIASFSMQFKVVADMKAGEQILYSYCMNQCSKAKWAEQLLPYGIVCTCPACLWGGSRMRNGKNNQVM